MASRPYRSLRINQLEQLFAKAGENESHLHAILGELNHRSTVRALDLKRRVEKHLKTVLPVSPNGPASARSQPQSSESLGGGALPRNEAGQTAATRQAKVPPTQTSAAPLHEPRAEPEPQKISPDEARTEATPAAAAKPDLSPSQRGVTQLIDYVRVLTELSDKAVWSLGSYGNLVLHETQLSNRVGIRHDLADADGPIFLRIDRLRRIDPPDPAVVARDWLTVSRDPFKEPIVQSIRTAVMTGAEAAKLIREGAVDTSDVTPTLKSKPGEDLRDVILRLDRFLESKAKVGEYLAKSWIEWAQAERPRRETIDIYDRLFSLQQALKLEGSDRPLEVAWGMGVARWKLPPHELDHPIVEQLVELDLDDAGAIQIRPRGVDPILALKPFTATNNPGTDLVARFTREHFAKLSLERDLSPFERETFTPILRYACAQLDRAGRYYPDHVGQDDRTVPEAGPNLVITDTWAIYARPRLDNFFVADLERLKEAVETADPLPGPAVALVTEASDEPTYTPRISGLGALFGALPASSASPSFDDTPAVDGKDAIRQLFFPKPFNDEQIAIVERLESPDVEGVVVQGPPGTGKTHTIANIICHYLVVRRNHRIPY